MWPEGFVSKQPPKTAPFWSLDDGQNKLLATVAHDMRTPLTSIVGYADLLEEGGAGALNDEQLMYVRSIAEKSEVLLHLVNQLADGTRIHAPALVQQSGPVHLADLCRKALSDIVPQAKVRNLTLQHQLEDAVLPAHIDIYKLRCILTNLLSNAVKYTPDGGTVSLMAAVRQTSLLHMEVIDTGIGIPTDQMERIFEAFYQVRQRGSQAIYQGPAEEGSGLGLAIVRDAVHAMDGTISVQSQPQRGSAFVVDVPL